MQQTLEERGLVPPLDDLPELPFDHGIVGGLNEEIVYAGYHPSDYGRNLFRAFGGLYPPKESEEWQTFFAPFALERRKRTRAVINERKGR